MEGKSEIDTTSEVVTETNTHLLRCEAPENTCSNPDAAQKDESCVSVSSTIAFQGRITSHLNVAAEPQQCLQISDTSALMESVNTDKVGETVRLHNSPSSSDECQVRAASLESASDLPAFDDMTFRSRKQYVCPFCNDKFTFSPFLTKHVYRVHRHELEARHRIGKKQSNRVSNNPLLSKFSFPKSKRFCRKDNFVSRKSLSLAMSFSNLFYKGFKTSRKSLVGFQPNQLKDNNSEKLVDVFSKKQFLCPVCNAKFSSLLRLNSHMNHIHQNKNEQTITLHSNVDSGPNNNVTKRQIFPVSQQRPESIPFKKKRKKFECVICNQLFIKASLLSKHRRRMHRKCSLKRTSNSAGNSNQETRPDSNNVAPSLENGITLEIKKNGSTKLETSNPLNPIFADASLDSVQSHKAKRHSVIPEHKKTELVCLHCKAVFHTFKWLVRHLHNKHKGEESHRSKCVPCEINFESMMDLYKHMDTKHRKEIHGTYMKFSKMRKKVKTKDIKGNNMCNSNSISESLGIKNEPLQVTLQEGLQKKFDIKPFRCTCCDFVSNCERGIKIHRAIKHCISNITNSSLHQVESNTENVKLEDISNEITKDTKQNGLVNYQSGALSFNKVKVEQYHQEDLPKAKTFRCLHCSFESAFMKGLKVHKATKHGIYCAKPTVHASEKYCNNLIGDEKPNLVNQSDASDSNTPDQFCKLASSSSSATLNQISKLASGKCNGEVKVVKPWLRHPPSKRKKFIKCLLCDFTSRRNVGILLHMKSKHKDFLPAKYKQNGRQNLDPSWISITNNSSTNEHTHKLDGASAEKTSENGRISSTISTTSCTNSSILKCHLCPFTSSHSLGLEIHMRRRHTTSSTDDASMVLESSSTAASISSLTDNSAKSDRMLPVPVEKIAQHKTTKGISSVKMLSCPTCNFRTKGKRGLSAHFRRKHGTNYRKVIVPTTKKSKTNKFIENAHNINQDGSHMPIIPSGSAHGSLPNLTGTSHKESRSIKLNVCEHCPFVAKNKLTMLAHKQFHRHNKKSAFKCSYCSFWASTKPNLEQHLQLHVENVTKDDTILTEDRPTTGDFVSRNSMSELFSNIGANSFHKPSLSLDDPEQKNRLYPFNCMKCPAKFLNSVLLENHEKLHGSLHMHACFICDYKSPNRPSLNRHLKMHCAKESASSSTSLGGPSTSNSIRKLSAETTSGTECHTMIHSSKKSSINYQGRRASYVQNSKANVTTNWCHFNSRHRSTRGNCMGLNQNYCSQTTPMLSSVIKDFPVLPHNRTDQSSSCICSNCPQHSRNHQLRPVGFGAKSVPVLHASILQRADCSVSAASVSVYRCHLCPFGSSIKEDIEVHMWRHGSQDAYRCPYCNFATAYPPVLADHQKLHLKPQCSLRPHTYMHFGECQIWKRNQIGQQELLFDCDPN